MWWEILKIEYTEDEKVIQHAYVRLVGQKSINSDDALMRKIKEAYRDGIRSAKYSGIDRSTPDKVDNENSGTEIELKKQSEDLKDTETNRNNSAFVIKNPREFESKLNKVYEMKNKTVDRKNDIDVEASFNKDSRDNVTVNLNSRVDNAIQECERRGFRDQEVWVVLFYELRLLDIEKDEELVSLIINYLRQVDFYQIPYSYRANVIISQLENVSHSIDWKNDVLLRQISEIKDQASIRKQSKIAKGISKKSIFKYRYENEMKESDNSFEVVLYYFLKIAKVAIYIFGIFFIIAVLSVINE